jgi:hypothetical protein
MDGSFNLAPLAADCLRADSALFKALLENLPGDTTGRVDALIEAGHQVGVESLLDRHGVVRTAMVSVSPDGRRQILVQLKIAGAPPAANLGTENEQPL